MASTATPRISPLAKAVEALMKLSIAGRGKAKSPVVHVLMADGRTTEFARRAIALPESAPDEASSQVYALLINGNGEVFVNPDGTPAILDTLPLTVTIQEDGDKMISLDEVARRSSASLSTIYRQIEEGALPQPTQISKRRVALPVSAVKAWLAKRAA